MSSLARRSACTVVNTSEVATSATTSTLVKIRILWVSPTAGPQYFSSVA